MATEVGSAFVSIMPSARGFGAQLGKDVDRGTRVAGTRSGKTFGSAFSTAGAGAVRAGLGGLVGGGILAGVAGGLAKSISAAKDFDLIMRQIGVQTNESGQGLRNLSKLAIKMGRDTVFSAAEAGQAMLELAKGGLDAATISGGALEQTLTLASAGGTDLASAATFMSNALNTFGLRARSSGKVAAALAGGANASTASVESLGQALSQVGPGAKLAGLSIQETVGALAAFDNAGIKGSDAGTSLKTMLLNLVPSTSKAQKAMDALGLSFNDAHGNMLPLRDIAQKLQKTYGDMSEAEQQVALKTAFGNDAFRAAAILMDLGGRGIDKYVRATSNLSAAQQLAKTNTEGAAGAWENLKGSVETLSISIGTRLLPTFTRAANGLTAFIGGLQGGVTGGNGLAASMSRLGAQVADFAAKVQIVAGMSMPHLVELLNSLAVSLRIVTSAFRTGSAESNRFGNGIDKVTLAARVIEAETKLVALNVRALAIAFRVSAAAPIFFAQVATKAFRTVVSTFLSLVGAIVNGAARAFGWIPEIGGKLKAAAGQFNAFRSQVEASLAGLGGAGQRAGAAFTAGLAAGIQSGGNVAVATAQGVANKITAAVNSAKGFDSHSPSKKGIQSGRWLIEGVAVGIRAATATGVKAAQDMADRVSRALENRLSKATDRLSALKDRAAQAFETAAGGVRGFLDISSIGQAIESQVTTPGATIIDSLTGAVSKAEDLVTTISSIPSPATLFAGFAANAKAFADALGTMARKKFPVSLISQIAGSGNLAAAQALASLSPADTASVISDTNAISRAAGAAGAGLAKITVDPKLITAAQATVTRLTAQSKQLDAIEKRLQSIDEKKTEATATIRAGDLAVAVATVTKKNARRS